MGTFFNAATNNNSLEVPKTHLGTKILHLLSLSLCKTINVLK